MAVSARTPRGATAALRRARNIRRCIEARALAKLAGAPLAMRSSRLLARKASARGPPMWKLVIEDDEGKRTVVPLTRDQYSIGRKDGNTIRLTERNVSREHARLYRRNGVASADRPPFVIEDLTSYNGVFINGLRCAP